jgi:hypothetical protein
MECPPSDAPLGCSNHGSNTLLNLDALFAEGTPLSLDPHQRVLGQLLPAAGLLFSSKRGSRAPRWVCIRRTAFRSCLVTIVSGNSSARGDTCGQPGNLTDTAEGHLGASTTTAAGMNRPGVIVWFQLSTHRHEVP